jgi:uncharacterized protein (AIM24 family)
MNVKIAGNFTKYLEAEMPPNEIIISEAGAMTYYDEGIEMEVMILNNGVFGLVKRMFSGEGMTLVKFINKTNTTKKIVLSSNAVIYPIKIDDYNNELICAKISFFSSTKNINISIDVDKSILTGLFGGLGILRQKITGTGTVFLKGYGEIQKIEMNGNKIILDSSAILAFTKNLTFNSNLSNPLKNVMAGEGGSKEEISGYGTLWIQCYNDPIKSSPGLNIYNWLWIVGIVIFIIYSIFFK